MDHSPPKKAVPSSRRGPSGKKTTLGEGLCSAFVRSQPCTSCLHNDADDEHHGPTHRHNRVRPQLCLTHHLASTYKACNPTGFRYVPSFNPRRALTKPSQGVSNHNYDNENHDLILYVGTVLGLQMDKKCRYEVIDVLGTGTFGQVVKCRHVSSGKIVAIKIVKNKRAYHKQGLVEVDLLRMLNTSYDCDALNFVKLLDHFVECNHLCIVFELLSSDLFSLLKQNHYRGLSTNLIRIFLKQLLIALEVLRERRIIHCDLKPENILLRAPRSPLLKLIDFGSACFEGQTVYSYIQSRFYRSPEVLIGLPYDSQIDMWSLGCICAELFLGLPIFPGQSEFNQLERITAMLGDIPEDLLRRGNKTGKFYVKDGPHGFRMKTRREYELDSIVRLEKEKKYFAYNTIPDLVRNYPLRAGLSEESLSKERNTREAFIDFLHGVLHLDPVKRWSPRQARGHPFVLGTPFKEPYVPPPDERPVRDPPAPPPPKPIVSTNGTIVPHQQNAAYPRQHTKGVERGTAGVAKSAPRSSRRRQRSVSHGPSGGESRRIAHSHHLAGTAKAQYGYAMNRRYQRKGKGGQCTQKASMTPSGVRMGTESKKVDGDKKPARESDDARANSNDVKMVVSAKVEDDPKHAEDSGDNRERCGHRTKMENKAPKGALRSRIDDGTRPAGGKPPTTTQRKAKRVQKKNARAGLLRHDERALAASDEKKARPPMVRNRKRTTRSSSTKRRPPAGAAAKSRSETTSMVYGRARSQSRRNPRYRTPDEAMKES